MTIPRLAICGNGASAAALLCALARNVRNPVQITVVGTVADWGRGTAYSTQNQNHLLNTPAGRMSIDVVNPRQFSDWLNERGLLGTTFSEQFVSRSLYGKYLQEMLATSVKKAPQFDVDFRQGRVTSLERRTQQWRVHHGATFVEADIVVLATGNDLPSPIADQYDPSIRDRIIDNPWGDWQTGSEEKILVLGTGLTAVDTVISLYDRGHRGPVHLISRRGLLPTRHVDSDQDIYLPAPYPRTVLGLFRAIRHQTGRNPAPSAWQRLIDNLRPHWSEIWRSLPDYEKRRFLRHAAAYWSVHRHRIAPSAADDFWRAENVAVSKGRLRSIVSDGAGRLMVEIERANIPHKIVVDRIVNCTGPNSDPQKSLDPLMRNILAAGYARAGKLRLGLDVDDTNRVKDLNGNSQAGLFAMGALTRDSWWEITAIPEISRQADEIAYQLKVLVSVG